MMAGLGIIAGTALSGLAFQFITTNIYLPEELKVHTRGE